MKSMTGYGKADFFSDDFEIEVELKSLNHRFFELKTVLPRELNFLETKIRNLMKKNIKRGKIDLRITLKDKRIPEIEINKENIITYYNLFHKASKILEIKNDVRIKDLLKEPNVTQIKKEDNSIIEQTIIEYLEKAINCQKKMAANEGKAMKASIKKSMKLIKKSLLKIKDKFPEYKEELYKYMKDEIYKIIDNKIDSDTSQKILTECAIYVEKADVNEEIIRLDNHISKFLSFVSLRNKEIGKNLNFILQEMHREINTIGSKFSHNDIFDDIIIIKEEIEKCREIVQNVE